MNFHSSGWKGLPYCALLNLLCSCETVVPIQQHDTNGVEATLSFKVEGVSYTGVATVQRKSSQKIEMNFRNDTAWALFSTCHRDLKLKAPVGYWKWYYTPAYFIENVRSCVMIHKQITNKGAEHYAIINFTAGETLAAEIKCNGSVEKTVGASICQARAGSEQAIVFEEPVTAYTDEACSPVENVSTMRKSYNISPDFCAYVFEGVSGKIHRHVTYGYQKLDLAE